MGYDYKNLSPADFEDLARDLVGRDIGVRFEAFTPGPDQGIDGRHSSGKGNAILQAKHFIGSKFSALKAALKKERKTIDKLSPDRYLLVTSIGLTPGNKKALSEIIGTVLKNENDIYGQQDLDGLLRSNPDIAKTHIKLWLSGQEILDHIVRAAAHAVDAHVQCVTSNVEFMVCNPSLLWDTAFRQHIAVRCKHLLFALFFCSEYGCDIEILREVFEPLHIYLSEKYCHPRDPKDFDEALKVLEGGFVDIGNRRVSFVNPSLRDYLSTYLDDKTLLTDCASAAKKPDWANNIWKFAKSKLLSPREREELARKFKSSLFGFLKNRVWTPSRTRPSSLEMTDLSVSRRLELLVEWWSACGEEDYATAILDVVQKPAGGFSPWLDGRNLIDLLVQLPDSKRHDEFPNLQGVLNAIEDGLINLLGYAIAYDDLEKISDKVEEVKDNLSERLVDAVQGAMAEHVRNIDDVVADIDSEAELEEQIRAVKKFAERARTSTEEVENAIKTIKRRIIKLEEEEPESGESPSLSPSRPKDEKFDDDAIKNLFQLLLQLQ